MKNKCQNISLAYAISVQLGNVNASHNEANVITCKKVTRPDGSQLPYISGNAWRRILRNTLAAYGYDLFEIQSAEALQKLFASIDPKDLLKELIRRFPDVDLLGYMDSPDRLKAGGENFRTSPVRVSALKAKFNFAGDTDLGTKAKSLDPDRTSSEGSLMFETEIYYNLFLGHMLIETSRIGHFNGELVTDDETRAERIKALIRALSTAWGGGRAARLLSDLRPRLMLYARTLVPVPVSLDDVKITYKDNQYHIDIATLQHELRLIKGVSEKVILGVHPSWGNYDKINQELGAESKFAKEFGQELLVCDMSDVFSEIIADVPNALRQ